MAAAKFILHSPVSDEALLDEFVEQCLRDQASLVAIVGPGSERIEDIIDALVVGDASSPDRILCTTSHPDEPLDDVVRLVQAWEEELGGVIQEVRL
ncbi:MAG TPA: hypothetical protein VEA44_02445 [Caulobacter sp.]|nr:hypothetical protein [Caulobacter sp.]